MSRAHLATTTLLSLGLLCAGAGAASAQRTVDSARRVDQKMTVTISPDRDLVQILSTRRGLMGITVSIEPEPTDSIGALVDAVTPGSPASRSGIRTGDVILRVNGQGLAALARQHGKASPGMVLVELSAGMDAGDTARLEYRRGTAVRRADVVLEPMPQFISRVPFEMEWRGQLTPLPRDPSQVVEAEPPWVGPNSPGGAIMLYRTRMAELELAPMNPGLGQYFGTPRGVLVINVPDGSRLNLRPGDVVLSVDGRRVASPDQLFRVLLSYGNGEELSLEIMRMKRREVVTGRVGEAR